MLDRTYKKNLLFRCKKKWEILFCRYKNIENGRKVLVLPQIYNPIGKTICKKDAKKHKETTNLFNYI